MATGGLTRLGLREEKYGIVTLLVLLRRYVTVFKRGHACSANHCGSLIPVTKKKKGGQILMGPIASWV